MLERYQSLGAGVRVLRGRVGPSWRCVWRMAEGERVDGLGFYGFFFFFFFFFFNSKKIELINISKI